MAGHHSQRFFGVVKQEFEAVERRRISSQRLDNATKLYMLLADAIRQAALRLFGRKHADLLLEHLQAIK